MLPRFHIECYLGSKSHGVRGKSLHIDLVHFHFLEECINNLLRNKSFHKVPAGILCISWKKSRYGIVSTDTLVRSISRVTAIAARAIPRNWAPMPAVITAIMGSWASCERLATGGAGANESSTGTNTSSTTTS